MLTLFAPRTETIDTPDTGTFPDGAIPMPLETQSPYRRIEAHAAYARDYGTDRRVRQDYIGYA